MTTTTPEAVAALRERLGGVSSPLMNGDNLAIMLCSHFDDPDASDDELDDCGWSPAAIAGYEQVCDAIHAHYAATLTALSAERDALAERVKVLEGALRIAYDFARIFNRRSDSAWANAEDRICAALKEKDNG